MFPLINVTPDPVLIQLGPISVTWYGIGYVIAIGVLLYVAQIEADLDRDQPMQRLLQGEVGSGKTVVALLAMLQVVDTGGQAVLLAPTEVLAQQHHRSMVEMLGPMAQAGMLGSADAATRVRLLTGSMGVLEIAERFALSPTKPKRSIVFVWHTGEENGLLGSAYFAICSLVPAQIAGGG